MMNEKDIEIIEISIYESFSYAGKVFHGLDDIKKAAFDKYSKDSRMKESPYVVIVDQSYPCFDSSDSMYENRSYQNYYFTTDRDKAERICKETEVGYDRECRQKGLSRLFPVLEPMFSMTKIEEHHLPYIYYHGDGDTMEIVQDKRAKLKLEILNPTYRFSWHVDPEPTPCLYGPQPTFIDDEF